MTASQSPTRFPRDAPRRLAPALLAGLALALAGCSASDSLSGLEPVRTTTSTKVIGTARFGDAKPMDFGANHPGRYPVHGIDVSKYQGEIDWEKVRANGIAFAFMKATEGGDRSDARFGQYWRQAGQAGIVHAPYHFYYFCTPAAQQAAWYIANVPRASVKMPPVIDMEWNPQSPSCKLRPDPETVRSEMQIWLNAVERHYGKKPIIYTTVDFHRENLNGHFRGYQFWLRSVAAHPEKIYPNHHWTFWQYTGTGVVPGIEGDADINVFGGSQKAWRDWLKKHAG
ncbi:lysozyme [Hoeflea marina]|uniref:Lysozyme n=1 Tax=Hoeflea marina TaxID=274592 RepID=A0A317PKX9_9HYPH|nr:GH25 family lysozyme [Hoeflea marina]PWV99269.1 lysozyme [Hoeflea marina]